jgi:hypothetical protein
MTGRETRWQTGSALRPKFWREHGVLIAIIAGYIGAGFLVDWTGIVPGMMDRMKFVLGYLITPLFALLAAPIALAARFGSILREAERTGRPLRWSDWSFAWRRCRSEMLNPNRLLAVVAVTAVFPVFLTAFGSWKAAIPEFQPFRWDETLRNVDLALHGGVHPWKLLQPALGNPKVTSILDRAYQLWLLSIPVMLSWQAWSSDWHLRRRFLIAFTLSWIVLGTVGAIAASSVGPCFFGLLTGDHDSYGPLMRYLRDVNETTPLKALETQRLLWWAYQLDDPNPFTRISAMPSVHVAVAGLYAILGWRTGPWVGVALTFYAALILIGSIHLGWHYAIDGYVSLIMLVPIWWLGGRLAAVPRQGEPDGAHRIETQSAVAGPD